MKILIIDNSIAFTGAFKCALNEAECLSNQHEFIFLLSSQSQLVHTLEDKGFRVYTLPLKEISKSSKAIISYPFALFKNLKALQKIVQEEQIDVVQVNDFYNLLGAALKYRGYKGMLITYVRFLPSVMPAPLRKIWIRAAQQYSHRVVAVSDAVLKQLPFSDNTIRIYDPVKFEEQDFTIAPAETINLLYLANFTRGKGQEHAVEAFHIAYVQNNKLRLKFVGGDMGLEKNAAFRNELIERVKALKLDAVISFEKFSENVEEEIKQSNIVLNFSEAESFSMTCLEASFYGRALIATRCGGPEEIIDDHKTGILVQKKDIVAMSDAIVLLANDEQKRKDFGTNGRVYVCQKFSKENFIESFSAILNDV